MGFSPLLTGRRTSKSCPLQIPLSFIGPNLMITSTFFFVIYCHYIVNIYLNLLCMCHCIWPWGMPRMVKCVFYPQKEKSNILMNCTVIFSPCISNKFTEFIFSILLLTYCFHGSYYLEWPHHPLIKTRILGVIFISFLSCTSFKSVNSVVSASCISATTLIQVLTVVGTGIWSGLVFLFLVFVFA